MARNLSANHIRSNFFLPGYSIWSTQNA